ncbi:hypothetical protein D3C85_1754440 [compost metagenome]
MTGAFKCLLPLSHSIQALDAQLDQQKCHQQQAKNQSHGNQPVPLHGLVLCERSASFRRCGSGSACCTARDAVLVAS